MPKGVCFRGEIPKCIKNIAALTNDIILGIQFATTTGLPMVLVSDKGHTGGLYRYAIHIFLTNQSSYTKTWKSDIYLG